MFRRQTGKKTDDAVAVATGDDAAGSSARSQRHQRKRIRKHRTCISRICGPVCSLVTIIVGVVLVALGMIIGLLVFLIPSEETGDVRSAGGGIAQSKSQSKSQSTAMTPSSPASGLFPPEYPKIYWDSTGQHKEHVELSAEVIQMCTKTLWHTLETTTIVLPDDETFIHTGDIDDLWLRDSAAQIHPLIAPLLSAATSNNGNSFSWIQRDPRLERIVRGLIKRCAMYIRHDPYANAFRIDDTYVFSAAQKRMGRHDLISTWNYELDSGCYYIRMLYFYWKAMPGQAQFLRMDRIQQAVTIMVDLWIAEQRHEDDAYPQGELFDCQNCNKPYRYPGLKRAGKGTPTNPEAGLTWTGFRPSDDECMYGYLIPANMFTVVVLEYLLEMNAQLWHNDELSTKATQLKNAIQHGIETHGIVDHDKYGKIYAYEVDGHGNHLLMDDANIPSLLSMPYLGYRHYDPAIYDNTKRFIFSSDNPTYQKGTNTLTGPIEGYGSPHMNRAIPHNIWPMSLAMKGLVSDDIHEKAAIAEQLVQASAHLSYMHESFDVSNPARFTRSHFCWADSLFAELVLSLTNDCPLPSHKYKVMKWRDPAGVPAGGEFALQDQPIERI